MLALAFAIKVETNRNMYACAVIYRASVHFVGSVGGVGLHDAVWLQTVDEEQVGRVVVGLEGASRRIHGASVVPHTLRAEIKGYPVLLMTDIHLPFVGHMKWFIQYIHRVVGSTKLQWHIIQLLVLRMVGVIDQPQLAIVVKNPRIFSSQIAFCFSRTVVHLWELIKGDKWLVSSVFGKYLKANYYIPIQSFCRMLSQFVELIQKYPILSFFLLRIEGIINL